MAKGALEIIIKKKTKKMIEISAYAKPIPSIPEMSNKKKFYKNIVEYFRLIVLFLWILIDF